MTWHTDRSRYMRGFECAWKRLLNFHAFNTGIEPDLRSLPLTTGIAVHSTLEAMLLATKVPGPILPLDRPKVRDLQSTAPNQITLPDEGTAANEWKDAHDIALAIPQAYARIGMPWLKDNFDVLTVEREYSYVDRRSENGPGIPIHFNSRPDFTARDRTTNRVTVHDFKTASSFQEAREIQTYADNVQMMINSMQVKLHDNLDYFPDYYIHILLKGSGWSPSPLIHAYRRPGIPPMQAEDWQPKYWLDPTTPGGKKRSIGRAYSKQRVSDLRPIDEWVWEMPAEICAQQIIILGPFNVVEAKTVQFMRGLYENEMDWASRLKDLDWTQWSTSGFQHELDNHFPRTFNCYSYGSRCPYYNLCFKGPGWDDPFTNGYGEREPHHSTEPKVEVIR